MISKYLRIAIVTALQKAGLPCNEAAVRLLLMIAAHESGGFMYVRQVRGPALGLFQMEPATYTDTMRYISERQERFPKLRWDSLPRPKALCVDSWLAAQMARVYLMRFPEALPDKDNLEGLARYAKKYWNTEAGKATWEDYFNAYREYCT